MFFWYNLGINGNYRKIYMANFFGQYALNLDAQNRIVVPFRLRDTLLKKAPLYISPGLEEQSKYLVVYPKHVWDRVSGQINMFRNLKGEVYADRMLRKHLFGHTYPLEIDGNNRALLPTELRSYAKLDKKILMIGMQDVIEIWDEATWNKSNKGDELHKVLTTGAKEGIRLY